ncbi:sigma-70 family RNA polymerase sigma factor [Acidithiobacillus thiooxidans]|uniref:sigma-70 family RNA polymerase sigma factor n=1 Tax=Acidithiobacillus thiooxidans TaxID=930 RepID=UPI001C068167|nr:sigma-70 family RNA polymerase sigma factor [Acidithiobacillus thiooxidans]MBU2791865.1 sigma-70 family RNA polymerase sigma factor [Acidithiobacillus thiooxidans]
MAARPLTKTGTNDPEVAQYLREVHPMILHIAHRIQDRLPHHQHFDDMVQIGLQTAWLHRDHHLRLSRPEEFTRWLTVRAKGAMLDLLRDEDPLPRRLRAKSRQLEAAAAACRAKLMRPPTDQELAVEAGMTVDAVHQHFTDVGCAAPDYLEDYIQSGEQVPDHQSFPDTGAIRSEIQEVLSTAIHQLPANEKTALSLYILEELTLEEVSQVMGLSGKSSALRLVNAAIFSCRTHLAARHLSANSF